MNRRQKASSEVQALPASGRPVFLAISPPNPSFYVISGFRHRCLSESDSPIMVGAIGLLLLNCLPFADCYAALKNGWKIKN